MNINILISKSFAWGYASLSIDTGSHLIPIWSFSYKAIASDPMAQTLDWAQEAPFLSLAIPTTTIK